MSKYVTIAEAANALGCSPANIYQLIKTHKLETIVKPVVKEHTTTRTLRVQHVDLEELNKIFE